MTVGLKGGGSERARESNGFETMRVRGNGESEFTRLKLEKDMCLIKKTCYF